MRGRGESAAIASCLLNVLKRKNGIPPGNGCVLEMVASFFLLHKANQQVEKLPIETHVICQLPSQCRKKKKWYPSGQEMAVSSKWLHLFFLFNNNANQDKMTNRDPCNLPATFSM